MIIQKRSKKRNRLLIYLLNLIYLFKKMEEKSYAVTDKRAAALPAQVGKRNREKRVGHVGRLY
jgi:hypothetical protein